MEIVDQLKQEGIKVWLGQDGLKVAPKSKLSPALITKINEYKYEIVRELKNQHNEITRIENMLLNEFAKTNLALKVDSSVLGETIYFVSNNTAAEKIKDDGFVTYTAKELEYLMRKGLKPKELRVIHETKKAFLGSKVVK